MRWYRWFSVTWSVSRCDMMFGGLMTRGRFDAMLTRHYDATCMLYATIVEARLTDTVLNTRSGSEYSRSEGRRDIDTSGNMMMRDTNARYNKTPPEQITSSPSASCASPSALVPV